MHARTIYRGTLVITTCLSGVLAGDDPDFDPISGLEFVTITDVGNRDTNDEEMPGEDGTGGFRFGGVDYEYRMAITEVTIEQYFDFVVAYLPIYERNTGNTLGFVDFTGHGIWTLNGVANILGNYSPQRAADMSWEYAARYVNWLHNGKVIEEWAFETGVYDTSTFYEDDEGVNHHQEAHNPGARYWMPTKDEWVKAGHWDPEKNNGEGGYWKYANSTDFDSIPWLLPNEGGERNAGPFFEGWPLDVGSFSHVTSPWGMYDMLGGESELLEEVTPRDDLGRRGVAGSSYGNFEYQSSSSADILRPGPYTGVWTTEGLRLVSAVPSIADIDRNWRVDWFDVSRYIELYIAGDMTVDFDGDGELDIEDVSIFLELMP